MSTHYDNLFGPEGFEPGDEASWQRTLDAGYLAMAQEEADAGPLDASLRHRLEREGAEAMGGGAVVAAPRRARLGWGSWAGWAVAAALAFAFVLFAPLNRGQGTSQLTAAVDRAPDLMSWPFAGTTDEFKGASGTVYWSSSLQKGYMRLKNVPVNASATVQYQLWIVDPRRDTHPIDGGVFDVASSDVVVPIDSKLAVGSPAAFAITREKPGGVVVSAGPLLLVAKP